MENNMKELFAKISKLGWIIIVLVLGVVLYFSAHAIGNWWELRQQAQFDAHDAVLKKQVDDLTIKYNSEVALAREAIAKEQIDAQYNETLKVALAARGIKIDAIDKNLKDIADKYKNDQALIDAVSRGEISKLSLCQKQCEDSKTLGYPCRPSYCDSFK